MCEKEDAAFKLTSSNTREGYLILIWGNMLGNYLENFYL